MGRFDRYFLSQLLTLFGFFSLVLILLYWVNRAVGLFDQLIGDGQSALVFLEFSALALPGIIRIVVPLAAFVAALYVTNRLISESEIVVLQATGCSPRRLARPVWLFGLIVGLITAALVHALAPAAARVLDDREEEIANNVTAQFLTPGEFLTPATGVTVYVRNITEEGVLEDMFLADTRDDDSHVIYTASNAYLVRSDRGPQLVMVTGMAQTLRVADLRLYTTRFQDFTYDIGRLMVTETGGRIPSRQVSTHDLWQASADLQERTNRSVVSLRAEVHDRINKTIVGVAAALLGFAPLMLGRFSRFGAWKQIVGAVLLVVVVNSLESWGSTIADTAPERWPLIYVSGLTGLAIPILLLFVAAPPRFRSDRRAQGLPA
ncbi:LPS export ABC transporter permease LptF [Pelagovum pacificum]|uniref:LPS export ABC transporter permease LptF n=1 Tax=Pelagovum pacificum TaxID=2588711 RepID=UPI0018CFE0DB|nr:LPS export ABC transporter permease LptF [Pelagovum pacificum]QQA41387.1 LPS export ABC transporter permease LptF [Pelagovum pacificum]